MGPPNTPVDRRISTAPGAAPRDHGAIRSQCSFAIHLSPRQPHPDRLPRPSRRHFRSLPDLGDQIEPARDESIDGGAKNAIIALWGDGGAMGGRLRLTTEGSGVGLPRPG